VTCVVEVKGSGKDRSLSDPSVITAELLPCPKPPAKASSIRTFPGWTFPTTSGDAFQPDFAWLLGRTLVRSNKKDRAPAPRDEESLSDAENEEDGSDSSVRIPS